MNQRLHAPLLAVTLGGLSALGFAPVGWWPLTLLGLAGLAWLVRRATTRGAAFGRGWWWGLGHFTVGLNWIADAFTYQDAMPHWLGWVAVVLLSLYLALFPALATAVAWVWTRADRWAFALGLSAAWIANEWLRATLFTGFAWNPLAAVIAGDATRALPFGWALPWLGTYALSGLVMLAGAALATLVPAAGTRFRAVRAWPVAALLLLGGVDLLLGHVPEAMTGPQVHIVQPNIGQQNKWDAGFERANFLRLARLSGRPTATPRLILWPEAATPDYLEEEPWARARIVNLFGPRDVVMTGGVALIYGPDGHVVAARNSLFALRASDAALLGRYDKAHLVPFGEYLPARPVLSLLGLSRLAPGDLDFVPGPGPRTLALPGFGTAGFQLCYEIIFSGHVVDQAHRPAFLFNPSNDAWFGRWGPPQHLAQARLRAAEEGLPVIRATPTGISALIDANGTLRASLPWRTAGAIDARLPPPHPQTPFGRLGNLLALLAAGVLATGAIARARRAR